MVTHNGRSGGIGKVLMHNAHAGQCFPRPELHHTTIEKYGLKVLTKMLQLFLIFYLYKAYYNIVCTYISVLETPIHFAEILSYSKAGFSFSFSSHFSWPFIVLKKLRHSSGIPSPFIQAIFSSTSNLTLSSTSILIL